MEKQLSRPGAAQPIVSTPLLIAIAGVVAGYITLAVLVERSGPSVESKAQPVSSTTFEQTGPLTVHLYTSANSVASGGEIQLWIAFSNRSDERFEDLRVLKFLKPGFIEHGQCWKDRLPACVEPDQAITNQPIVLEPGESKVITASARAAGDSGSFGMMGIYSWKSSQLTTKPSRASKAIIHHGSTGLSGIAVLPTTGNSLGSAYPVVKALKSTYEVMAIPIGLGVLAWLLQGIDKRRQEQAESAKRDREEEMQVLNSQLPKVLEFATKHYMQLASAAKQLRVSKTNEKRFFWLICFLRNVRHMRTEIGGVFFENRLAETISASIWSELKTIVENNLGEVELEKLILQVPPIANLADFQEKMSSGAIQKEKASVEAKLAGWTQFQDWLALLWVFQGILEFEANRPFMKHWYKTQNDFDIPADKIIQVFIEIDKLPLSQDYEREAVRNYIQSIGLPIS